MNLRLVEVLAAAGLAWSASFACYADEVDPEPSVTAAPSKSIAYIVANGFGDQRRFELVAVDVDGSNPQLVIASKDPLMSPAWSPDGRQLAYVGFVNHGSAIYTVDLQTRMPHMLVHEQGVNGAPAWAPDGRSLAVSLSFGVNADIYVVDVLTGARRRLTDHPAIDTEPTWSPDGSQIAFTSDRGGLPQVYVVSSNGGPAHRVSFEGRKNMRAAYSPDGAALAYVSYQGSRSRIGMLDLKHGAVAYLSNGPMDESPSFSPDGASLIYADVEAAQLAVVGTDHRRLRSIPQQGDVHEVAWSFAGRVAPTVLAQAEKLPATINVATAAPVIVGAQTGPVSLDPMPVSYDAP